MHLLSANSVRSLEPGAGSGSDLETIAPTIEQLTLTKGNLSLVVNQALAEDVPAEPLCSATISVRATGGNQIGAVGLKFPEPESAFQVIERFEALDPETANHDPEIVESLLETTVEQDGLSLSGDFGTTPAEISERYRERLSAQTEVGPAAQQPRVRIADFTAGQLTEIAGDVAPQHEKQTVRWIDIEAPSSEFLEQMRTKFDLHPAAIADCLRFDQDTKAEDFGNHLLIATHLVLPGSNGSLSPTLHEVHFLLGKDFLITVHDAPIDVFETVRERLTRRGSSQMGDGAACLFYDLAQELNDRNYAALERSGIEIDRLFSRLRQGPLPDQTLGTKLPEVGDALSIFHKLATAAQRIPRRLEEFFGEDQIRSVIRRLEGEYSRELEETTYLQKRLATVQSTHNSLSSNAFMEHQRRLNILAGVAIPISTAAGIFGMNLGTHLSDPAIWSIVGGAFAIGMALVTPLLRRTKSRKSEQPDMQ